MSRRRRGTPDDSTVMVNAYLAGLGVSPQTPTGCRVIPTVTAYTNHRRKLERAPSSSRKISFSSLSHFAGIASYLNALVPSHPDYASYRAASTIAEVITRVNAQSVALFSSNL